MKDEEYAIAYYRCYPVGRDRENFGLGINFIRHEVFLISCKEITTHISNVILRIYEVFEKKKKVPKLTIVNERRLRCVNIRT
jgi:hypothetical protein